MKLNYWIVTMLSCTLFLSCSKKYTTRPQIEITSISTNTLNPGDSIKIVLRFRDREGDIAESRLYIERKKRTCKEISSENIPDFQTTKDLKGNLTLKYGYNQVRLGCIMPNDTCVLRFVLNDKVGNASDTISTDNIFIH